MVQLGVQRIQLPGYFYLPLDWKKKNHFANNQEHKGAFFLGSSRTAYSIDPNAFNQQEIINLGFVASSYLEQEIIARELLSVNLNVKTVWIELNPMGLTKRHMKAASVAVSKSLIYKYDWKDLRLFNFLKEKYFENFFLLESLITSALELKFVGNLPGFQLERQKRFLEEYKIVYQKGYNGFLGEVHGNKTNYKADFLRECQTMIRWSFADEKDELEEGLKIFDKMVTSLISSRKKVIFWLPPETKQYEDFVEKYKFNFMNHLRRKFPEVRIVDMSKILRKDEDSNFLDCIHTTKSGASRTSIFLNNMDWK